MKATLYFDGGARPRNPGPAGFACIVTFEKKDVKPYKLARAIGVKTNNQAEYFGLIVGSKMAADRGAKYLHIVSDSKLVIGHVTGEYQCKDEKLKPLLKEALAVLKKNFGDNWDIEWCKGHSDDSINNEVDELCTKAILAWREARRQSNPWTKKAGLLKESPPSPPPSSTRPVTA